MTAAKKVPIQSSAAPIQPSSELERCMPSESVRDQPQPTSPAAAAAAASREEAAEEGTERLDEGSKQAGMRRREAVAAVVLVAVH